MTAATAQLRHVCRWEYGESLAAPDRDESGQVAVYGSNGRVGRHSIANTSEPVVVIGRKGSYGKLQYSDDAVFAIDTTFFVDGTMTDGDLRWLYYAMSTLRLDELSQDVGVPGLSRETAYSQRVRVPSVRVQRRIAAFLDSETERVDQLIATKSRMIEVVNELDVSHPQNVLRSLGVGFPADGMRSGIAVPAGWRVTTLVRCLRQLTNGYVGPTRDVLVEEGVPYVQSLHIKDGNIDFGRRPFYVPHEWHEARPRIHLRQGDVLLVQTGDIGQVAVVPPDFGPASCHALQILRVEPEAVSGDYLGLYLRTPFGRDSLLARATGALHPHLEGGIRDVPVVVPPLVVQREVVADALVARERTIDTKKALAEQVHLLQERRRSLIIAAVNGELEVP